MMKANVFARSKPREIRGVENKGNSLETYEKTDKNNGRFQKSGGDTTQRGARATVGGGGAVHGHRPKLGIARDLSKRGR